MQHDPSDAVEGYLDAATKLMAMPLDPQRRAAVSIQLARLAMFAERLIAFDLDDSVEIAGEFVP